MISGWHAITARACALQGRRGLEKKRQRGVIENKKKKRKGKEKGKKNVPPFYRDPKRVNEIPYRVAQSLSPALSDIRQGRSSRFHPITHEFLALLHSVVAATLLRFLSSSARVRMRIRALADRAKFQKNSRKTDHPGFSSPNSPRGVKSTRE